MAQINTNSSFADSLTSVSSPPLSSSEVHISPPSPPLHCQLPLISIVQEELEYPPVYSKTLSRSISAKECRYSSRQESDEPQLNRPEPSHSDQVTHFVDHSQQHLCSEFSFVPGTTSPRTGVSPNHSSSTDDDVVIEPHIAISMETNQLQAALLKDQRYSIQMRSQAYASMAVVAALIAGISITFVVEVKFEFDGTTNSLEQDQQNIVYKCCAMGALLVCFLSLYATMVLSMQYYLVTRALGHVSTVSIEAETATLDDISIFMQRTLFTRHLAVKSVVVSVPLFAMVMAAFGVAKAGLGPIGYTSVGMGVVASAFFIHAVVVQQMAFTKKSPKTIASTDSNSRMEEKSDPEIVFSTQEHVMTTTTPSGKQWATMNDQSRKVAANSMLKKQLLNKASNQASNFRLVW